MITCATVLDALKVPNVIHVHVETNNSVTAYQAGDKVPVAPIQPPPPRLPAVRVGKGNVITDSDTFDGYTLGAWIRAIKNSGVEP